MTFGEKSNLKFKKTVVFFLNFIEFMIYFLTFLSIFIVKHHLRNCLILFFSSIFLDFLLVFFLCVANEKINIEKLGFACFRSLLYRNIADFAK